MGNPRRVKYQNLNILPFGHDHIVYSGQQREPTVKKLI